MKKSKEKYRSIEIVIAENEIAIWKPFRYREKSSDIDHLRSNAHNKIDEYFDQQSVIQELYHLHGELVIKGLQQSHDLREKFIENVFSLAEGLIIKHQESIGFYFGVTGEIKSGKSGQPNYQIKTETGKTLGVFRYSGKVFENKSMERDEFNKGNITEPFSILDLKIIWAI